MTEFASQWGQVRVRRPLSLAACRLLPTHARPALNPPPPRRTLVARPAAACAQYGLLYDDNDREHFISGLYILHIYVVSDAIRSQG
jgi:hypothetical protein